MADPACLELAVLSLEDEKFEQAQELFQVCLDRLPAAERKNYRDLLLVATPEELAQYEHTPEGQREEMIRRFWNRRDPTPLTEANERLLEHYRRVAYAREFFGREPYSWDARGDVYIRLGAPDHISRWNDIQAEMELDLQDARVSFVNRARIGLAIRPGQPIFPVSPNARWEYWIYKDVDGGIEITFTQEFEGRRFDYAPYPHGIAPSLGVQLAYFQGNAVIQRVVGRRPAIYAPDFADLPIDFFYYPASYRGAGGQTLLEIYYGLPASEVARLNVDEKTDLIVLDRGVALFDRMWNEVYRVKDQLAFAAPSNQQIEDGAFIPGVLSVDLPAGDYHMALQVRDVLSGKSQVYQQEIRLDEYGGSETLRMSDIELAFVIAPTEDQGEYVKQGLKVIPMSSRSFRRTQNAFVYFEIYDLKLDEFGQTRYRVEYKIRSREKRSAPARIARGLGKLLRVSEKDEEIEIAYDQTGDRKNEVAYVELDLTKTHVGAQQVEVEVTDLVTDEKVSKEILFKIVP